MGLPPPEGRGYGALISRRGPGEGSVVRQKAIRQATSRKLSPLGCGPKTRRLSPRLRSGTGRGPSWSPSSDEQAGQHFWQGSRQSFRESRLESDRLVAHTLLLMYSSSRAHTGKAMRHRRCILEYWLSVISTDRANAISSACIVPDANGMSRDPVRPRVNSIKQVTFAVLTKTPDCIST